MYEVDQIQDCFYLHLMTPSIVDDDGVGRITLSPRELPGNKTSGFSKVLYEADRFQPQVDEVELEDPRLAQIWGPVLYRINLRATDPKPKDSWRLRITK